MRGIDRWPVPRVLGFMTSLRFEPRRQPGEGGEPDTGMPNTFLQGSEEA